MEEKIILTCETCGAIYEKPKSYKERKNIFFKWNLKYCDKCRKEKQSESLRYIPVIIKALNLENE